MNLQSGIQYIAKFIKFNYYVDIKSIFKRNNLCR